MSIAFHHSCHAFFIYYIYIDVNIVKHRDMNSQVPTETGNLLTVSQDWLMVLKIPKECLNVILHTYIYASFFIAHFKLSDLDMSHLILDLHLVNNLDLNNLPHIYTYHIHTCKIATSTVQ